MPESFMFMFTVVAKSSNKFSRAGGTPAGVGHMGCKVLECVQIIPLLRLDMGFCANAGHVQGSMRVSMQTMPYRLDSPVPECYDPIGELGMLQVCKSVSCQTKVSQFEVPFIVDEQVGCLEVPVDDAIEMAVCQPIA